MAPVLNSDTILKVAKLYDMSYDESKNIFPPGYLDHCHLTNEELAASLYSYTPRVHLTVEQLQSVMDWKYPRGAGKRYAARNGLPRVKQHTARAFSAGTPSEAVSDLCELVGVRVRMASAILTAFDPVRYTVLDVRAWNALRELGLLKTLGLAKYDKNLDNPVACDAYLSACLDLSMSAGVSLRALDHFLWTTDQRDLYPWVQHGITLNPIMEMS
jgi:hypothetical protein